MSLYPTPSACSYGTNHGDSAGRVGPVRASLETLARCWPTAAATDAKASGAAGYSTSSGRHTGMTLTDAVVGARGPLWPSPRAGDDTRGPETQEARDRRGAGGPALGEAVLYPTPSARDWKSGASNKHGDNSRPLNEVVHLDWATSLSDQALPPPATGGRLNPAWVATLMGFPSTWLDTPGLPVAAKRSTSGSRRARSRAT